MSTEVTVTEDFIYQDLDEALNKIKDSAIMLTIASEYLCEDPFLKKMGFSIEQNVELLRTHMEDLKRQFVGKPVEKMDLNGHLEQIARIAKRLQRAENGIKHICVEGKLGKELGDKIISLTNGVNSLKEKIRGKSVSYSKTDSVLGFFAWLRFILGSFAATYRFALRVFFLSILILLATFSFLFITMQTEKGLLIEIDKCRTNIRSKRVAYSQGNKELKQIKEKLESISEADLSREDAIAMMDLRLRAYQLTDEQQKIMIEVKNQNRLLEKYLKELEEAKRKSFLERLLRL